MFRHVPECSMFRVLSTPASVPVSGFHIKCTINVVLGMAVIVIDFYIEY